MHPLEFGKAVSGRNILIDLPGYSIERSLYRLAQLHFAVITAAGVLRSVFDLLVLDQSPGIVFSLKCGRIHHERFNGTAGLPVALERAVQRERGVYVLRAAADHCHDLSGTVVYADSRALHFVLAVIRRVREGRQLLIHALLQLILLLHIERSVDLIAALEEFGKACVVKIIVYIIIGSPLLV